MWLKWLPWKWAVSQAATRHGFLDPIAILGHLRRFAEPSEVAEPLELLRAGMVFHARGLINSRAIQHNLDWVWPYWVNRQFDPLDVSFIPRAFSLTHINLTHRNWTALGTPASSVTPIVDPRGLLTPFYDGWSIDCWIVAEDGRELLPARLLEAEQRLHIQGDEFFVRTKSYHDHLILHVDAGVTLDAPGQPIAWLRATATANAPAWLVVSLRPYNPEGISFIRHIELAPDRLSWKVNGQQVVEFSEPPERHAFSQYKKGDVYDFLREPDETRAITCPVGLATAAASFALRPNDMRELSLFIDLSHDEQKSHNGRKAIPAPMPWSAAMANVCGATLPNKSFQFLFDSALHSLILHSTTDVYPGPYTYKRFWFRDASFILHAMLKAGMIDRAEHAINRFGQRQTQQGYFLSQEGEWDSNGEALWTLRRFCELSGKKPPERWRAWITKGAQWIASKRASNASDGAARGLLPAGFSAEHLGLNDYYYWDDFWGVAGLYAASYLMDRYGDTRLALEYAREGDQFMRDIEASLKLAEQRLGRAAMPAAPERRLDPGSIGSLAVGYPLQLWPGDDRRLLDTVEYLEKECLVEGCFYQDIIHSGLNPYLTLHIAQVLLRAGDRRFLARMEGVAANASSTGQWPEAVHPLTHGGCMGDGQHVWAAAEWVLMLIHCFVREEDHRLILGSGIPPEWLAQEKELRMGPVQTSFGPITVRIQPGTPPKVLWEAEWRGATPVIEIALPGGIIRSVQSV